MEKKMLGISGTRGMQGTPGPQQGMWWGIIQQHQGWSEEGKGDQGRIRAGWENCPSPKSRHSAVTCQVNPGPTARASGSVNPGGENPPSLGKGHAACTTLGSRERRENPRKQVMCGELVATPQPACSSREHRTGSGPPVWDRGRMQRCRGCRSGVSPTAPLSRPNPWHTVRAASGDGRRERDD